MADGGDHSNGLTVVTGAAGILGSALLRSARFAGAVGTIRQTQASAPRTLEVDLRDRDAVRRMLDDAMPAAIVHTVSLTDVDACERRPAEAYALSALTTLNLADWVADRSPETLLVYISSDQVYSGDGPHDESEPAPVNAYGAAKHAGELAAARAPRSVALRTNFYGRSYGARQSFTDWIARSVRDAKSIELDQGAWFSPLHLTQLVDLVDQCISRRLTGVYNAGAHDAIDKVTFAREVAARIAPDGAALVRSRTPEERDGRAPRPLDLRLDSSRIEQALERPQPSIADGLAALITEEEEARG